MDEHLKDSVDALEDIFGAERGGLCVQQSVVEQRKEVFPVLVPNVLRGVMGTTGHT